MDINRYNFPVELNRMLQSLASADFVAFDLELSGISSRSRHGGMQTLQQKYTELKEAAEKYQVLQVGFTLMNRDGQHGAYVAKTFNMYLNPLIKEHLEIERIFAFQSTALDFLLSHKFRLEAAFHEGVPYLSREEERSTVEAEIARADKTTISDIHLKLGDTAALNFVKTTRGQIEQWKNDPNRANYLNIGPEESVIDPNNSKGLSSFQRRLIHQLVRAEYPEFTSNGHGGRPGFVQIEMYDKAREEVCKKNRLGAFYSRLHKQVGLRWFVEAMVKGNLDGIDPGSFAPQVDGRTGWFDLKQLASDFEILKTILKGRRTILVGHNMFLDLIYFYKCFFGALPAKVEDFQKEIHALFPMIIDTKYMATSLVESLDNGSSALEELHGNMMSLDSPRLALDPYSTKYGQHKPLHEAGYDSLMTAQVLTRLSVRLENMGYYKTESDDEYMTPPETTQRHQGDGKLPSASKTKITEPNSSSTEIYSSVPGTVGAIGTAVAVKSSKGVTKKTKKVPAKSAFAHPGRFDLLLSFEEEESNVLAHGDALKEAGYDGDSDEEEPNPVLQPEVSILDMDLSPKPALATIIAPQPRSTLSYNAPEYVPLQHTVAGQGNLTTMGVPMHHYPEQSASPSPQPIYQGAVPTGQQPTVRMMPDWDSDFWNVYGNKLRVNGTIEGTCYLGD